MGTLQDYLEQDKDRLMEDLRRAGTPEKTSEVLGREMDRLLIQYNEQCESPAMRDAAAYMLQTVRNAIPLVDTVGETKVWEVTGGSAAAGSGSSSGKKTKGSFAGPAVVFCVGSLVCGIASLVVSSTTTAGKFTISTSPWTWVLAAAAIVMGFLAGKLSGGAGNNRALRGRQQTEVRMDPQRVYRTLRTVAIAADRNLSELESAEAWEKRKAAETGGAAGDKAAAVDAAQLDLYANLLEAYTSGDGQYALDKLADVKYYLHKQNIEAVDYSEKTAAWFDVMPSTQEGTLRPALVRDGKLLKKGLAGR